MRHLVRAKIAADVIVELIVDQIKHADLKRSAFFFQGTLTVRLSSRPKPRPSQYESEMGLPLERYAGV
jgi:hypothetical protein